MAGSMEKVTRRQMAVRVMPWVSDGLERLRLALIEQRGVPVTKGEALEFAVADALKRCGEEVPR